MTKRPLRVLCVDHEGGHGGSSRSLHLLLRNLPAGAAAVEVWCRRPNPLQGDYEAAGIRCRVAPELPRFRAQKTLRTTVRDFASFAAGAWRDRAALRRLARDVDGRFDLVHLNFESLWPLAAYLRRRTGVRAYTMHMRMQPYPTPWAWLQAKVAGRLIDGFVFITDRHAEAFRRAGGRWRRGAVIHNVAPRFERPPEPHPQIPADGRFKVACLANFAYVRGVDRIVEIAQALAARGRRDLLFVVAGESAIPGFLDGALGEIGRRGGTLQDYAAAQGVGDMVMCLGHVGDPERVLAACDALASLSRRDEAWSRDVIEALSMGRPVMATGSWSRFVEPGVSGYLSHPFDAEACADELVRWADDRSVPRRLGAAGAERMAQLCDGPTNAARLLEFWRGAVEAQAATQATAPAQAVRNAA